jgi:hypothetical protein
MSGEHDNFHLVVCSGRGFLKSAHGQAVIVIRFDWPDSIGPEDAVVAGGRILDRFVVAALLRERL